VADSRVVFAVDAPSLERARELSRTVRDGVGMLKIGLELFVEGGPAAVEVGRSAGLPVFLDLKLHDIPETVERAVARAAALGARWLTVHAAGGPAMVKRAVERARASSDASDRHLEIVAVTVLTSLDEEDLAAVGVPGGVDDQVERLARMAWTAGARTFVCSPREAARLRRALGHDATLVTPGVRAAQAAGGDDQKRTLTAAEAVAAGADWVVVGRPIRDAADPAEAARLLTREVAEALAARGGG
jgi:orotidine-5'-phosphate decarboxylase